jgi:hypothetical protein
VELDGKFVTGLGDLLFQIKCLLIVDKSKLCNMDARIDLRAIFCSQIWPCQLVAQGLNPELEVNEMIAQTSKHVGEPLLQ